MSKPENRAIRALYTSTSQRRFLLLLPTSCKPCGSEPQAGPRKGEAFRRLYVGRMGHGSGRSEATKPRACALCRSRSAPPQQPGLAIRQLMTKIPWKLVLYPTSFIHIVPKHSKKVPSCKNGYHCYTEEVCSRFSDLEIHDSPTRLCVT